MFRRLASQIPNGAQILVSLHPVELVGLLEQAWNLRVNEVTGTTVPLTGHPDHRSDIPGIGIAQLPATVSAPGTTPPALGALGTPAGAVRVSLADPFTNVLAGTLRVTASPNKRGVRWEHLIYAYMIENTRIYEIFRRMLHELLHGEKLGSPRQDTQLWLRSTEELFYRDPPPFSITTLNSYIRPDLRATRRNAYFRLFGMDLNHGDDENKPYAYVRPEAANNEFVNTFEELLREVWIGFTNRSTTSGANPTDDAKIEELARKLHDMLITRRQFGNLSRQEFFFVAMLSSKCAAMAA